MRNFHGRRKGAGYFEGWYLKHQRGEDAGAGGDGNGGAALSSLENRGQQEGEQQEQTGHAHVTAPEGW